METESISTLKHKYSSGNDDMNHARSTPEKDIRDGFWHDDCLCMGVTADVADAVECISQSRFLNSAEFRQILEERLC